jgi:hypothetical protein
MELTNSKKRNANLILIVKSNPDVSFRKKVIKYMKDHSKWKDNDVAYTALIINYPELFS